MKEIDRKNPIVLDTEDFDGLAAQERYADDIVGTYGGDTDKETDKEIGRELDKELRGGFDDLKHGLVLLLFLSPCLAGAICAVSMWLNGFLGDYFLTALIGSIWGWMLWREPRLFPEGLRRWWSRRREDEE